MEEDDYHRMDNSDDPQLPSPTGALTPEQKFIIARLNGQSVGDASVPSRAAKKFKPPAKKKRQAKATLYKPHSGIKTLSPEDKQTIEDGYRRLAEQAAAMTSAHKSKLRSTVSITPPANPF